MTPPTRARLSEPVLTMVLPVVLTASLVGGCGYGPVRVAELPTVPGSASTCAELDDALPEVIDDAVRRTTSPVGAAAAAWGQPPIILRCGSPPPPIPPDAQLLVVDEVSWYPEEGKGGSFFTTTGRSVTVRVAVPDEYEPAAEVLVTLAGPITATVPPAG